MPPVLPLPPSLCTQTANCARLQTEEARLIKGLLAPSLWLGKRVVTAAHPSAWTLTIHLVEPGACLPIIYSHIWQHCGGLRNPSCTLYTHQKTDKVPLLFNNNHNQCYSSATEQQVNLQMLCSTIHIALFGQILTYWVCVRTTRHPYNPRAGRRWQGELNSVFSYSHALQNLEFYTQVFFKSESSQLLQPKKPTETLDSLNCWLPSAFRHRLWEMASDTCLFSSKECWESYIQDKKKSWICLWREKDVGKTQDSHQEPEEASRQIKHQVVWKNRTISCGWRSQN